MADPSDVRTGLGGVGSVLGTATGAKSGSTVGAVINGVVVTVQVARDLTVAAGDVLTINKYGSLWVAVGRLYTAAPAATHSPDSPPPNPGTASGTLVVAPVETRSRRNGAWRTDTTQVIQGEYGGGGNHTGAAFYGSAPQSLVGATVTAATVQVRRDGGGAFAAQATTMRLVTESTRPSGAPTLTSSTGGPSLAVGATDNSFTVPTSWAQAMVGGTAGGLGFFAAGGSPYVRFAGVGDWSPAFTMTINWTR